MDIRAKQFFALILILVLTLLFSGRLFYLQVIRGEEYANLSVRNFLRTILVQAPRGNIVSREGTILAHDILTYVIKVTPADIKDEDKIIELLISTLGVTREDVLKAINDELLPYYYPRIVAVDIPLDKVLELKIKEKEFPGLSVEMSPLRKYEKAESFAHAIGYVDEISKEELFRLFHRGYTSGDRIGKTGVEKQYEEYLRGIKGKQVFKVDVLGKERFLQSKKLPEKGNNLVLTLSDELQLKVSDIIKDLPGAAILMNPKNGEILAFVSNPNYNPNYFVRGLGQAIWNLWMQGRALVNRAISGQYPPGSTFKALVAIAGLESGMFTDRTVVNCRGFLTVGGRVFRCWTYPRGHGAVDMREAIAVSCNVYFYTLGAEVGINKIVEYAENLGFGKPTGIDLPNELQGLFPNPQWKREKIKERWYAGDTANLSIGQGYLLATPLQMASFYSFIANGVYRVNPHIVKSVRNNQGEEIYRAYFPPLFQDVPLNTIKVIKEGLRRAVTHGGGLSPLRELPIEVAAKTGTAQTARNERPHLWLVAYAPANDPEVVAVILSESSRYDLANRLAPYMRRVLEAWIEYKNRGN
ncbi:MAG: Peptidoglycan D,D-transpeptidase MrdA [candidate division WS2 bacterium]|nr:Peptidoglycan D,D-transpeptidase MrdA [Candidatus Psychracetigena formicireducens]